MVGDNIYIKNKENRQLDKKIFRQNAVDLAKSLLNQFLIREYDGKKIITKIVETEAYMGINDKAAHVYKDKKSVRTGPLYLEGGHIYVYLIYGMYNCLNISANEEDIPECVLIRGVEPIDSLDEISFNRYEKAYKDLSAYQKKNISNGPGKLCKALKIDRNLSGKSIFGKELYREENTDKNVKIITDKRINIDYSEEAIDYPYRLYIDKNK